MYYWWQQRQRGVNIMTWRWRKLSSVMVWICCILRLLWSFRVIKCLKLIFRSRVLRNLNSSELCWERSRLRIYWDWIWWSVQRKYHWESLSQFNLIYSIAVIWIWRSLARVSLTYEMLKTDDMRHIFHKMNLIPSFRDLHYLSFPSAFQCAFLFQNHKLIT